jgi:RimJ/RimL family protein N-acetyltransferase
MNDNRHTPDPSCGPQRNRESIAAANGRLELASGTAIRVRPLDAGDGAAIAALFARLSPESRWRRFLTPKLELSQRELKFLTDVDHVSREALAAIDPLDGSVVGVARYVTDVRRAGVADVAFEVADELQRRGIGTELARRLVQLARLNGFSVLTATTLWENRSARSLLRGLGFRAVASHGTEIDLELSLV